MRPLPRIQFTHTGIFVSDLARMEAFYTSVLGFVASDRGVASTGHELIFMTQDPTIHHQLVIFSGKPTDLPFNPVNQLSLLVGSIDDLKICYNFVRAKGIKSIDQVDHGNAWSMYFNDPEDNPIEMYVDTPFYSAQPCREPLDLTLPSQEILHRTSEMVRRRPGFMTREDWIESMRKKIAAARPVIEEGPKP